MIKRPSEEWLFEDIEKVFGIKRIKRHPILMEWLNVPDAKPLTALEDCVETWNEDECQKLILIMYLITKYLPNVYSLCKQIL